MKIITLECKIFVVFKYCDSQDDNISKFKWDRLLRKNIFIWKFLKSAFSIYAAMLFLHSH